MAAQSDDPTSRYRVYFLVQDSFLFQAIVGFDTEKSPGTVADIESALATLTLTPHAAHLRAVAGYSPRALHPADHDVLGRYARPFVPQSGSHVIVPLFSRY